MKGDAKVIEYLNKALRSELTAINQYWLHYRLQSDWGFTKIAQKSREESIEEMQHADKFVDRIIFLEGFPNLQTLDPLRIGQTLKETLECDLAAETEARDLYREAAEYARSVGDLPSKQLFEETMADEEGHIDFLETQLDLMEKIGEANYGMLNASPANAEEVA
ncbi:MAG: bacterioferritin [Pseudomonadota bacterium]